MPTYTRHAEARMLERGISKTEVEETLAHPIETRQTKIGRFAACGSAREKWCIIVIY